MKLNNTNYLVVCPLLEITASPTNMAKLLHSSFVVHFQACPVASFSCCWGLFIFILGGFALHILLKNVKCMHWVKVWRMTCPI